MFLNPYYTSLIPLKKSLGFPERYSGQVARAMNANCFLEGRKPRPLVRLHSPSPRTIPSEVEGLGRVGSTVCME